MDDDVAWHTIETMDRPSFSDECYHMAANANYAWQNGEIAGSWVNRVDKSGDWAPYKIGDNHPYSGTGSRALGTFRRAMCDNSDWCPPTYVLINSATAWELDYRRPVYWVYFHYLCHVIECADSCC
jgi:hypothetical protein